MANITLKGNPIHTSGELPAVGAKAPAFTLVDKTLAEKSLADFAGKKKVLTINPSYDTGVCATTARAFNKAASELNAVVLMISGSIVPGLRVKGFGGALIAAIAIGVVAWLIGIVLGALGLG